MEEHSIVSGHGEWTLYYDGNCRLCRVLARWLSRMDVFKTVRWLAYQDRPALPHGLSWEDVERAAFLESGGPKLHEGFYAFRMLALRIPLLFPLTPILWLPGVNIIGSRVYRLVARNRRSFFGCGKE